MNYKIPPKPAEIAENRILEAILDGDFPINSTLPGERELAAQIGVTRPTLREALQRLARDGWLEIRQGKPTRVRDYWHEGSLGVLSVLAQSPNHQSPDFVTHLLEIRLLLAPTYTRQAIAGSKDRVSALLRGAEKLEDSPSAYASYDWNLHHLLTQQAQNPVFILIINSFEKMYSVMGKRYFSFDKCREHSRAFYAVLLICAEKGDNEAAEALTRKTMQASLELWRGLGGGVE